MAITVRNARFVGRNMLPSNKGIVEGFLYDLYSTSRKELSNSVLDTTNAGQIVCLSGSEAVTRAGERMILDSDGSWYELKAKRMASER